MQGALYRLIDKLGVEVQLVNYESQGSSSRGTHWTPIDSDPDPIMAIPDPGSKSLGYDALFGAEVDADTVYLLRDEYDQLRDGGGDGASRIIDGDDVFVVVDAETRRQHGLAVLECNRDTESDL
ncbi:hypothetical protein GWK26_12615 [haloarchaeon 3A1-DGR]|nr:hypothetical protein GWK26_12615 [haloarchaeon 3A1-DGR]